MYNDFNDYKSEVCIMKKILTVIFMMFLLTSCEGNIVARVGDTKITQEEFGFYLNSIKEQMQGTELKTDTDWENQEIEGKKAIEIAKERALDIAVKNALYTEASKAKGIQLGVDEKITVERMKTQIVESYGNRQEYENYLKNNNITDKFMDKMIESSAYQSMMYDEIAEKNPITEEDMQSYYSENKKELDSRYRKAKHILILTTEPETGIPLIKTEKDKAKRQAESIYKKARSGEDFDALMHEFSQDPGLSTAPDGYVFGTGEMVPEFEEAVDETEIDGFALCESSYGYHVIKRLPVSYEDVKDSLTKDIMEEKIDELAYQWAEEYGVEIVEYEENYKEIK